MNIIAYYTMKYRTFVMVSLIAMWVISPHSSSHTRTIPLPPKATKTLIEPPTHHYELYDWAPENRPEAVMCLAKNIYFEGRGETQRGQIAIGLVTINRVQDDSFPSTICGVVFQRGVDRNTKKIVAQFSWTLDGKSNKPNTSSDTWERILLLAQAMTAGGTLNNINDITIGATHYHANYINPNWTDLTFIVNIDNHTFYRTR